MAVNQILNWVDGAGWLVLSGGSDALSEVRAMALTRIAADGGIAYVGVNTSDDGALMDDFNELGAPAGFWVDIMTDTDQGIHQRLAEAALIVLSDMTDVAMARSALLGAAAEGMLVAFQRGAVILAEGHAAMLFGRVVVTESGQVLDGLHWLRNAYIVPAITSIAESSSARKVLLARQAAIAIGIGVGSALVLGPDAQVELWGQSQVAVALGGNISDTT